MLVDFSAATLGAPQSALDIDLAELLVACTVLVGPDRALAVAVDAGWGDAIGRLLPYLQRAALTPHLRDLARTHELDLKELRAAAAAASGQEEPELMEMRRIHPRDLLLAAALILGAYLLISKLAAIGFGTIAHEVARADTPGWPSRSSSPRRRSSRTESRSAEPSRRPFPSCPASCSSRRSSSST